MLVSLSKKFVFIHIYKTGGSSVKEALQGYCYHPQSNLINRSCNKVIRTVSGNKPKKYFDIKGLYPLLSRSHRKASDIEAMKPKIFNKFYTFAFVRNPWDWQVSLYYFMLENPGYFQDEFIKEIANFKDYIKWRVHNEVRYQSDFLYNQDGELAVDYVGRLETIEEDFNFLCNKLSLNASLPHINRSQHKKYLELYDEESKELVDNAFQKDIKLLGYSFDAYDKRPVRELIQKNLKYFDK
jgi:hypothetical protein